MNKVLFGFVFEVLVGTRVRVIAVHSVSYDHVNCIVKLMNAVVFYKYVNFTLWINYEYFAVGRLRITIAL